MKQIIYSQKNLAQHNNYSKSTTGVNNQSNPITRKLQTLKKNQHHLSNISQTAKQQKQNHYHHFNQINSLLKNQTTFQNGNISNNNIIKTNKPTPKPHIQQVNIISEYKRIINNLNKYWAYYQYKLKQQIQKHDKYFNEIIKIVEKQRKISRNFLTEQIQRLKQQIIARKVSIKNTIIQLQNNNIRSQQKQRFELQFQKKALQIPLFQVNLRGLDAFKQQFKLFVFQINNEQTQQISNDDNQSIAETIQLSDSIKFSQKIYHTQQDQLVQDQKGSNEINQMTPISSQKEDKIKIISLDKKIVSNLGNLEDQDLHCDEDFDEIMKENKIVRKKVYKSNQDPIPEQSQSHEDSYVVQNGQ